MNKGKKALYILLFISIDVILLCGFVKVYRATMLNNLRKEISLLEKKELSSSSYSNKIVTLGGYAKIEGAIKNYLYDYSNLLKDTMKIVGDSKLKKILSYDNYLEDGVEFKKSISYLKKNKELFNKNIDKLITQSKKKSIKNNINNKIYYSYYRDLYNELFVNEHFVKEFDDMKTLLEEVKKNMNNIYDTSLEVLNFLVTEKENWVLEDGEIKFQTKELYDKYMGYINKIQ